MSPSKILIVDDKPAILEMLARSLKDDGHIVLTAGSGEEAVAIARTENPAAILLDIRMPGMDGIGVLREIRAFDQSARIILITALGSEETLDMAMRLGAYDYITKPFDLFELRDLVKRALGESAAQGASDD